MSGGFADFIQSNRLGPGEMPSALERARWAPEDPEPDPFDNDERVANLLARRYEPGQMSLLHQRLEDTVAELETERSKIAAGVRRAEHVRRMREGGLGALDAAVMLDGDFGDERRADQLERRAASLRRQIEHVAGTLGPAETRAGDPVEAATSRAHRAFVEATRAALAGQSQPAPRRRPPFASAGGIAVRSEQVTCAGCIAVGATPDESFLLHSDPAPVPVPDGWSPPADQEAIRAGRMASR